MGEHDTGTSQTRDQAKYQKVKTKCSQITKEVVQNLDKKSFLR
jgi:hypothetical protein